MKFPSIIFAFLAAVSLSTERADCELPAPAATNAPELVLPAHDFNFGKITMGETAYHTFIVSNEGNRNLEITRVTPGCHCTTAGDWTHTVPPGKTGTIPLKFNSAGVHGDFHRSIAVESNDPHNPRQILTINGSVWTALEVVPQLPYISAMPDAPESSTVAHVYNRTDKPLTLSTPTSANPHFKASLSEVKPGMEWALTITAIGPLPPGNSGGTITVNTSSPTTPVLSITTLAVVQPSIGVSPIQIAIPLNSATWTTNRVVFASNEKTPLVLSNPQVCCDKRVSLQLKELNPGKVFELTAIFPPNYQSVSGQESQISVKSNYPDRPSIIVPIRPYNRQPVQEAPRPRIKPLSWAAPAAPTVVHQ